MRYWKKINDGIIVTVGTGNGGEEITESEYNEILSVIRNKPAATGTTCYRLKTDLTWEAYEVEPPEEDPEEEVTAEEIAAILLGGAE